MQGGFTVAAQGMELKARVFGQKPGAALPLVTWAGNADRLAVLMGRLRYRRELCRQQGLPSGLAQQDNDAALALALYAKGGRTALAALEGDYALVVSERQNDGSRDLWAQRDPRGGYPLFWIERDGLVAVSTSIRPLVALLPRRTVSLDYVSEFVMLPGCGQQELADDRCAYEGVHRVLAGTRLSVSLPGGSVRCERWWDWAKEIDDLGTDDLDELGRLFRARVEAAIDESLRGRVAAHLSGGMDSTAVALIARNLLQRQGRGPLHTLSFVYDRLSGLARERPYVESVLDQPGLVPHRVLGDDVLDFDGFRMPPLMDEPCSALSRLALNAALTAEAAAAGVDTVCTGAGGDDLLSLAPYHLADLIGRGRLWLAWSEAAAWGRYFRGSVWSVLGPYGVAPLLPFWLRRGPGPWLNSGHARWARQDDYTIPPWIRRDFARRHGLYRRGLANLQRTVGPVRSALVASTIGSLQRQHGDYTRWYLAAPRGIHLVDPMLDMRVVRLGLGIQRRVRPQPGVQKPILAAAMRDVLPDAIRNRPRKGSFNEVFFLGLSRNLPLLEQLIHEAPIDDLELLDREVLLDCLRQTALGLTRDACGMDRLSLTLSLLQWLSTEKQWASQAPLSTEILTDAAPRAIPA
jgi:asparagine synthase (glutamine-hydrolysing)